MEFDSGRDERKIKQELEDDERRRADELRRQREEEDRRRREDDEWNNSIVNPANPIFGLLFNNFS